MLSDFALPAQPFVLKDICAPASVLDGLQTAPLGALASDGMCRLDLGVKDGLFCAAEDITNATQVAAAHWTILPRLVDSHVHLDKSMSVTDTGFANGTLLDAIQTYSHAAANWDQSHFERRMWASVQQAVLAGTGYMRSHIDCFGDLQNLPSWHAAQVVKDAFQGIIDIQLCTLTSVTRCDDANFPTLCKDIEIAGGVLGAFVPPAFQDQPMLERFLAHADAFGLDVDFHIDENLTDSLPVIEQLADAVIATGFQGRVMAGHVCALLNTQGSDFDRVLDKIATAGISIVSLPRTNLYLQDRRGGDTPRRRGITAVHEMRARGISVSFGTDNVADAFYPFGDYDMIGLLRDATVAAHLDQDLNGWLSALTKTPARALGLDNAGKIAPGLPANAVLLPATNWPDLLNDKRGGRINMIAGKRLTPEMIPQPKGHA